MRPKKKRRKSLHSCRAPAGCRVFQCAPGISYNRQRAVIAHVRAHRMQLGAYAEMQGPNRLGRLILALGGDKGIWVVGQFEIPPA